MKKNILLVLFALISVVTQAQEIKWMSMQEAVAAQQKNKKPIFIDAYTVWCGPCKMLDKNTFADPKVAELINRKYNPVKFNAEGNEEIQFLGRLYRNPGYQDARAHTRNAMHEFAGFLKVQAYPNMFVLNPDGKIVKNILGYHTPEQLLPQL